MGGYSKTGPFVNNSSPGITATFLNAVESVLSRGSGDTETGKYFLTASSYVNAASMGAYVSSISRSATPASVTTDTADQGATGCNAPSHDHLSSSGFHVYTTTIGVRPDANAGGNYTLTY